MLIVRHNPVAIAVAMLIYFFLGAAWFIMFMNSWLVGIGRTMAELKVFGALLWLGYVVALIMIVIFAVVLFWVIQVIGFQTAVRGVIIVVAFWFGFVLTIWVTEYAFEARGIFILVINIGYFFVGMLLMGLVFGGWKAKPRFV